MAYSKSVNAIVKVRDYLEELVTARGNVEWRASDPNKFAYQLREAISVANKFKDQYAGYASLRDKYAIKIVDNRVVAQLKDVLDIQPVAHGRITISNVSSVLEIVSSAIQHKAPTMHFPNATTDDASVAKLRKWCEISDYVCEVDQSGMGIFLTKK